MAASYPTSAKSFSTKATTNVIEASHVNDLQDEVTAVETALLDGVTHDVKPSTSGTRDLGTSALLWRLAYLEALIIGAATTDGIKLEVNSGVLDAREGDDSAAAPFRALTLEAVNGQVVFPATQVPSANANTLDDYEEGSFTGTLTGVTTSVTPTVKYTKVGNKVTIEFPYTAATSNATTKTITGMPAALWPAANRETVIIVQAGATFAAAPVLLNSSGVLAFYRTAAFDTWADSGSVEIRNFQMTYTLA